MVNIKECDMESESLLSPPKNKFMTMRRPSMDATSATAGRILPKSITRLRYWFVIITVSVGTYFFFTINTGNDLLHNDQQLFKNSYFHHLLLKNSNSSTIQTEGCSIPSLKTFDDSIIEFVQSPSSLKRCVNDKANILLNNNTHIWLAKKYIKAKYPEIEINTIQCCYRSFYRPDSIQYLHTRNVDKRVKYSICHYFESVIKVRDEFVSVSCTVAKKKNILTKYYAFTQKKPELLTHPEYSNESYNVIIMGIDGVSRLNLHRTMPKTVALLKDLGAIELLGYNKVGDNTFPNLIPMLMGIKDTDLKMTCLPNPKSTFDNCPLIWEWYSQAGYYTALAEDSSSLGTFNFGRMGFTGTPVHYYLHTFINEAERVLGTNKDFNCYLCMNEKYFYQILLEYMLSLTKTLSNNRLFGFFWEITMSHDHLNYPMVMDSDYKKTFIELRKSGYLNKTVIIFISDHGIRWGKIRLTKQGRLEERLPFAFLLLPPSFQERYPKAYNNINSNVKRLTTPFDIHATLMSLLDIDTLKDDKVFEEERKPYAHNKSISLFYEVPGNRTCETAGIDIHWCTCRRGVSVPVMTGTSLEAGAALVNGLNNLLRKHPSCAHLRLASVEEATELQTLTQGASGDVPEDWREYLLVVRTIPGDGLFEGTMRRLGAAWSIAGTVSRLNQYGHQSHCIEHYQLKLYCFCL